MFDTKYSKTLDSHYMLFAHPMLNYAQQETEPLHPFIAMDPLWNNNLEELIVQVCIKCICRRKLTANIKAVTVDHVPLFQGKQYIR